ncbi:hypothetical protein HYH03_018962 [Edaphochlamys debaryana]|uniref:EGF-like domain-containing protein n=1 Tax=Edaphochlamys debaryana TaxID=47281 RepID=A0A835XCU6_9CHLO|nr:hypothetical protein HYH03_018962 [Edaphochlamys debaryana]|eukprot:KAG2482087.1 hypothetical protein HYH03_018962 [Edaphochlamys debaryana]
MPQPRPSAGWRSLTALLLATVLLSTTEDRHVQADGELGWTHGSAWDQPLQRRQLTSSTKRSKSGNLPHGISARSASVTAAALDDSVRFDLRNSKCLVNCTVYGTCNEELGRCDCPRTRSGEDCSRREWRKPMTERCREQGYPDVKECLDPDQNCLNACNRRGVCQAGFCHCKPGFFGADCSLSLDSATGKPELLAGQNYTARAKRPWVYVYDLPPHLTQWNNHKRLDRPTHLLFWQRLLSSGARVADGDAADYYFIPVRQRSFTDSGMLVEAIKLIRAAHPWWNQTGGARHFVIQTGDWGRVEASEEAQALTVNMTWLTHWGLTKERGNILRWNKSHRVDRDVVVPVYISPGHYVKFAMVRSPLHPAIKKRARNATQLFFAGRICLDQRKPDNRSWPTCGDDKDYYSGKIREKVFVAHWNRSSFRVVRSEPKYGYFMSRSSYCLAPPGAGHGQRQIQSLFMGCVPVTIGDGILEPFEPALSWSDFGVRVAEDDIPRLHQILEAIGPEELAQKQERMRCAAQHMLYSSITGALFGEDGRFDAFETTLEVLRVMRQHPDAPPESYRAIDKDFDAFMDCRDPPGFKWLSGIPEESNPWADLEADAAASSNGGAGVGGTGGAGGDGSKDAGAESKGAGAGAGGEEGGEQDGEGHDGEDEHGGEGDSHEPGGEEGAGKGASTVASSSALAPPPGKSGPPPLVLCSHCAVDLRRHDRSCYYFLRGAGHMGVPGGAICARGHRYRLAQCPRLWG